MAEYSGKDMENVWKTVVKKQDNVFGYWKFGWWRVKEREKNWLVLQKLTR